MLLGHALSMKWVIHKCYFSITLVGLLILIISADLVAKIGVSGFLLITWYHRNEDFALEKNFLLQDLSCQFLVGCLSYLGRPVLKSMAKYEFFVSTNIFIFSKMFRIFCLFFRDPLYNKVAVKNEFGVWIPEINEKYSKLWRVLTQSK